MYPKMRNFISKLSGRPAKSVEWVILLTTMFYTATLASQYYVHGFDTLTTGVFGTIQLVLLIVWSVDIVALLSPKWKFSRSVRLLSLALMILASLFYSILQIIDPINTNSLWIYSLGMTAISFIIHLSVKFDVT
jgi:hypothetical protein